MPESQCGYKHDAGGNKGKLLCCKCIFEADLAEIQLKKHQVKKTHFLQKQESMG